MPGSFLQPSDHPGSFRQGGLHRGKILRVDDGYQADAHVENVKHFLQLNAPLCLQPLEDGRDRPGERSITVEAFQAGARDVFDKTASSDMGEPLIRTGRVELHPDKHDAVEVMHPPGWISIPYATLGDPVFRKCGG